MQQRRSGFYFLYTLLELCAVLLVLFMALYFQFVLKELPCPLCLLQRLGFLGIAFALLLNLRFGPAPSHYGLSLLAALLTAFVALRQVALHVIPGSGAYGSSVLGFHMYTWSFVLAMAIVLFNTIVLSVDRQYFQLRSLLAERLQILVHVLFALTLLFSFFLCVSVFLECGLKQCPENPQHYLYASNPVELLW